MPLPKFCPARLPFAVAAALLSAYSWGAGDGVEQVDLPTVQVQGIGKQTTSNYTIPTSSAATGIRLTQRETPQSLSVVTEKQMDDQGLDTLQDVLKQTPGVFHSKMGNNVSGHSEFISRSQAIDSISVDGAPKFLYDGKAIRRGTNNLDSALYEQVVVVVQAVCPTAAWANRAVRLLWNAKNRLPNLPSAWKPVWGLGNTTASSLMPIIL